MSNLLEKLYAKRQGFRYVSTDQIKDGHIPTEVLLKMYEHGRTYANFTVPMDKRYVALEYAAQILKNTSHMPSPEEKLLRLLVWWNEGVRDYTSDSIHLSHCEYELLSLASMMVPPNE